MNDCPNADIRDQLPDLLHERLDVSVRAAVMAHVDSCVDCRAELELLRGVHGMLVSRTPRVDVNYIVNALPKRAARPVRLAPRRRVWSDWRIAAAVTVMA
ncbi:MAG TPA: zf-HC2 domain-containing protein, partial [Gemmatimonadaceae bacterium]